jgi:acetyl/propionyl-CoA carboxylase alpha subunit
MIEKLFVWGDTGAEAIGRLSRVLDEYRVIGVRTTLPFFRWLVSQPEFVDGAFDTTYLDALLASRKGRPFVEASDGDADDAAIIAALATWFRVHQASAGGPAARPSGAWQRAARTEGLR